MFNTFTGDFLVNYHTFTGDFSCQRYKKAMMMQNFSNQEIALKADVFAVAMPISGQSPSLHFRRNVCLGAKSRRQSGGSCPVCRQPVPSLLR